jgi:hypothetical protein
LAADTGRFGVLNGSFADKFLPGWTLSTINGTDPSNDGG